MYNTTFIIILMVIWHFFCKCRGVLVAMIHPFCATRAGKTQSTWSLFFSIFGCKRLCDVVFSHDSPVSERCALAGHRVPDHWHTTRHVWWTHLRNGESACLQSWWRRPRHYSTGDFFFSFSVFCFVLFYFCFLFSAVVNNPWQQIQTILAVKDYNTCWS